MTALNTDQKETLRSLIKKHRLESVGAMIEDIAQSAVQIVTSSQDDYSTLGNSRIGGLPDLPLGVEWPTIEGWYLVFVAQINLAELPYSEDSPLPQRGILYFFHGRAEPAWNIINHVMFFDGPTTSLKKAEQPDIHHFDEDEDWAIYSPCNVLIKPLYKYAALWI